MIGKEEAGALKDMIATRSYVPEGVSPHHPSDNVSHYYLDDGYFFRGQLSDLDECITTGAIVRVGQGKDVNRTYVSREFRDVFGMFRDKWSVEDQGIFIYPSAYFNRSVNDGSAEAGFCTIERDGWVTTYALQTWPHFKIDLPVGQAKYLIVHRRKYEEYMDILKDKKPDPKGLKPQLQKLMKNGLKIVPVGKSEDESAYVNYKDIVHEIFTAVKRRRVGRLYLFLADEGREMGGYGNKADVWLPKAVFWVLQSPEMAAIREKITSDKGLIDAVAKANGDEVAAITMLDKAREEQLKKVVIVIDDNGLVAELTKKGIEAVRADNEAHAQQLKKEYASSFVIIIHPSNQTIQLEGLPPVAIEGEVAESLQKLLDYNV